MSHFTSFLILLLQFTNHHTNIRRLHSTVYENLYTQASVEQTAIFAWVHVAVRKGSVISEGGLHSKILRNAALLQSLDSYTDY